MIFFPYKPSTDHWLSEVRKVKEKLLYLIWFLRQCNDFVSWTKDVVCPSSNKPRGTLELHLHMLTVMSWLVMWHVRTYTSLGVKHQWRKKKMMQHTEPNFFGITQLETLSWSCSSHKAWNSAPYDFILWCFCCWTKKRSSAICLASCGFTELSMKVKTWKKWSCITLFCVD